MNSEQDNPYRQEDAVAKDPVKQTPEPRMFQSTNWGLRGVGGWLLFFIIGVGILRPLQYFAQTFGVDKIDVSKLEAIYPRTVTLIYGERVINSALVIFGIILAIMLWKVHKPVSVTLAKIFLICNGVVPILDVIIFHNYTDLPPKIISDVESQAIIKMIVTVILSGLWFSYFLRSERVRATYLSEPYQY